MNLGEWCGIHYPVETKLRLKFKGNRKRKGNRIEDPEDDHDSRNREKRRVKERAKVQKLEGGERRDDRRSRGGTDVKEGKNRLRGTE